ncbi:ATP-binding protein [Arachidicoccus terrestris]|uniref:ATP-binding protein n=1 Tax=Arachidicoccus terrestris TaxID=2875539 RepID=UPI001CC3D7EB|nr:sensor histidine kinase [Arachidicoccus terrestris]UAY55329.1 sensor histidine kinase [Arachidicoccus terrestris]
MRNILFTSFLVAILVCSISGRGTAQNRYIDSLKNELDKRDLPDSSRLKILLDLGNNLYLSNKPEASKYFWQVFQLARNNRNDYYQGEALSGLGNTCYERSEYDSAMYYYHLADSLYATDPSEMARESSASNKASMGNIEVMRNNYETAMQYFTEGIAIMKNSAADNKWQVIGNLYADIGNIYNDMDQTDKALTYDLKALESHKKQSENYLLTGMLELYVASDYTSLRKMEQARTHLTQASHIAKQLNAPAFYYSLYSEWGRYYQRSSLLPQAADSFQKSLKFAKQKGSKFDIMTANKMMGYVLRDMKDYQKSADALLNAFRLVKELNNIRQKAEILKNLALVEAKLHHDHDAVQYYQQYLELNDRLNQSEMQRKINEIENKYQNRQKTDSIIVLQKSAQVQRLELHRKKAINIFLVVGCGILLFFAGLIYINFKRKNQLLKQSEVLQKQEVAELQKAQQIVAMQSVLKGQEQERSRLARDLHDGVGGLLSVIKLSLSGMKGNVFLPEESAQSINNIITQLDQSIGELRRVSHNMMPEALIKYGLKEALENYCSNLNFSGKIKVQLQTYGMEQRMEQSTEIILYRIIQELLNNIIKHAQAKSALVQIVRTGDRFSLTVEDDGKGFDIAAAEGGNNAGLANIRARAAYLGGTVDIQSSPEKGTSVNVEGECS